MKKHLLLLSFVCTLKIASGHVQAPSPVQLTCIYDLNNDGVVTNTDLLLFLMNYGLFGDFEGDFDENGSVGVSDFIVFMRFKGSACQ